jgi:hypothetical protein
MMKDQRQAREAQQQQKDGRDKAGPFVDQRPDAGSTRFQGIDPSSTTKKVVSGEPETT